MHFLHRRNDPKAQTAIAVEAQVAAAGHDRLRGCLKANIALEHGRGGCSARGRLSDLEIWKGFEGFFQVLAIKTTAMAFEVLFDFDFNEVS